MWQCGEQGGQWWRIRWPDYHQTKPQRTGLWRYAPALSWWPTGPWGISFPKPEGRQASLSEPSLPASRHFPTVTKKPPPFTPLLINSPALPYITWRRRRPIGSSRSENRPIRGDGHAFTIHTSVLCLIFIMVAHKMVYKKRRWKEEQLHQQFWCFLLPYISCYNNMGIFKNVQK